MSDENEQPAELPAPTHTEFDVSADEVTILSQQLGGIAGAYFEDGKLFVPNEIASQISTTLHDLPAIVLASAKSKAIAILTDACAAAIVSGYTSSALGSEHQYPSKVTDQINMMGSVTDSLLPEQPADWSTPFWCADETGAWAFRLHTATQIQAAGVAGKAHILQCQTILGQLSAQVMAAASAEAVEAIVWEAE
ncbi:hypothetical protein B5K08_15770 [Rhizobium leguminosarum bv. trifolii]|uniref:DUF4376 domain-containing protein n=1 Tax=Rhizobium leguminosarum bv. trifolii TaxID=386 RepID=A0A3E1BGQ1_RHILT|nr:hypothetical protein [Rhizobium leguminosarum]RFB91756.1 hypothetical protein B5K08_15770 [Rhizobium leguminosarum bv. trifolii]RFB92273.1 hypothetical protein B5K10_15765 [Rhizobium leguminosarum bv. trifolii]